MVKKSFGILAILFFLTGLTTFTLAQTYSGTLRGKIINEEGAALPDASIYLSSPNLLGIRTYFTSETGNFIFSGLPPGFYRLMVEIPEYKTVSMDNIIIRAGKTAHLSITMETTPTEEKITRTIPTPTIDTVSPKNATSIDKDLLRHIPFLRNLVDVVDSMPGVATERVPFLKRSFIHGQDAQANTFAFDGIFMADPMNRHLFTHFTFDTAEEIQVETAAHPAEVGATEAGYVNVITKSGEGRSGGELVIYHTSDNLSSLLRPGETLNSPGISPPALDKRLWDFSLSLGGLLYEDRLSYFGNARVFSQKRTTPFIPWADPQGIEHKEFHRSNVEKMGFLKFTSRFIPELQVSGMFNYNSRYRSVYESSMGWNRPKESTHTMDLEINYTGTAVLSYRLNQNTMAFGRMGFTHKKLPLGLDANGRSKPQYFDQGTERLWGSAGFNEDRVQDRFQLTASITHFQENFLGGDHELKAGAEIEFISSEYSVWKADNMLIHYYYDSPNFFGQDISPSSGFLVNKGMISFSIASGYGIESNPKAESRRLSAFVQDSITLWERLTLTLGLRFDRSDSELSTHSKGISGNDVSLFVGENIIQPLVEINPYELFSILSWKNIIVWNAFSPRIGLSFDIFGNGKSVFKASFSRYTEPIMLDYLTDLNPMNPYRSHQFIWFDENMNDEVDITDTYVPYPEDYRIYLEDYSRERVAPG
ncbi:MAG: TonB-dependent receptor, partial [Candidatus Aminicenantes bacterium]